MKAEKMLSVTDVTFGRCGWPRFGSTARIVCELKLWRRVRETIQMSMVLGTIRFHIRRL